MKLGSKVAWIEVHGRLRGYYSNVGRRGLPIRLMVGLHILKHMNNMSDEQCVDRIRGDLYWMAFCGVDVETLRGKYAHLDRTSMIKFRGRIGEKGFAEVEDIIREYLLEQKQVDSKTMITDSTCMEKNIAYPLDTHLLDKGRRNLLKGMEKLQELGVKGVDGLRSFSRTAKRILITIMKLGKDRAERIQKGTLELSAQAVHVIHKCEEQIKNAERLLKQNSTNMMDQIKMEAWVQYLKGQKDLLKKVVNQSRQRFKGIHVPNKVYSLHEPQVIVVRKGKRAKSNEYGSKVNFSISKEGYIVSHEVYYDNHHDSELLEPAVKNWEKTTGDIPDQLNADRGYKQKETSSRGRVKKIKRVCIPNLGKTPNPDAQKAWFKKGQKFRAGIEAVLGHLKQDHRMDCCRYSGYRGDKINVSLGSLAWNLNKLARNTC